MKKAFCLLTFLFCFTLHLQAQTTPIEISEKGYIMVDVALNDSIKGRFMLDTGSGIMVLSDKFYQRIKASTRPDGLFTGFRHDGDRIDMEVFRIPSVTIASRTQTNMAAGVYPPLDDYGIDGLISLKFFEDQPFTIDFKNRQLIIESPQQLKQIGKTARQVPVTLHKTRDLSLDIFVPVCLSNNVSIAAEFDTGSGFYTLMVNPYFLPVLGLDTANAQTKSYTTPLSKRSSTDYLFKLPQVSFCNTPLQYTPTQPALFREGLIYEGLIGSEMFKDKILSIDIPNKRLLVRD